MNIIPPHRDPSLEDSTSGKSPPIQYLALAMNELMRLQWRSPISLQLDTHFWLPKFLRHMNGDVVGSWVCGLSTYFKTFPGMIEEEKLQITSFQLEGVTQSWWDTQTYTSSLVVDLGDHPVITFPPIGSWDDFFKVLHNRFYTPGYH